MANLFTSSGLAGFGVVSFLYFIFLVVWFITLWVLVARTDLEPVNKLTWVVIVGLIPVAGVLLYYIFNWHRMADDITHAIQVTKSQGKGTTGKSPSDPMER